MLNEEIIDDLLNTNQNIFPVEKGEVINDIRNKKIMSLSYSDILSFQESVLKVLHIPENESEMQDYQKEIYNVLMDQRARLKECIRDFSNHTNI